MDSVRPYGTPRKGVPEAHWRRWGGRLLPLRDRLLLGLALALFVAAGFCAYVVLLFLLRGSAPFEALGTTLSKTLLVYLAGAIVSGVVLGVFLPLGRTRVGAMVLASLAIFPLYKGVSFAGDGFDPWTWSDTLEAAIPSLLGGVILGWWVHRGLNG